MITYINPFLPGPLWQGLVWVFALFLVTFLSSLFNGQYFLKTFVVGFRIRSGLISAIYRKSLRISSAAKKDTTVGEIVNLMSVDAQRFFELVSYLVSKVFEIIFRQLLLFLTSFFLLTKPARSLVWSRCNWRSHLASLGVFRSCCSRWSWCHDSHGSTFWIYCNKTS